MKSDDVKNYFSNAKVVFDYTKAVDEVGLWNSERAVFAKYFTPQSTILELGCGAGRISINLALSGYENLTATDFSPTMTAAAKAIVEAKNLTAIKCRVCDATQIDFAEKSFDGVIFGFNGLMQIPLRKNRRKALVEIRKVLKEDGILIFTTHDRECKKNQTYWELEQKQWRANAQQPILDEFGDICYKGEHGNVYIHSPSRAEISEDLRENGFEIVQSSLRSEIASEPPSVEDFSDECIFWVVRKCPIL